MSSNQAVVQLDELSVLLVEPSSTQHKIIIDYLNKAGVTNIDWVQTGQAAIEHMSSAPSDVTISAMHMEDFTGTELVQKMREMENLSDIPFMLISSETNYRYLEPIRQAGTIALLPKPFSQEQLNTALQSTLLYISPENIDTGSIDVEDLKVLVVDDSPTARKHITRVLTNMGFENITHAGNGNEAVAIVKEEFFDLIVTDYNMPEMDGGELVEHVRTKSNQSSIPILMVSSESDENRIANVQKSGVSAICDKPFDTQTVRQILQQILH